jgi:hypothetical protein
VQLSLVLADQNAVQFGEAWRAGELELSKTLNGAMATSFTLNSSRGAAFDDLAPQIRENKTRIKVYADATLAGHLLVGPCKDGGSPGASRLMVTAADPLAAVLGRRTRQNETAYARTAGTTRSFTATDKAQIAKALVDDENLRAPTWIRTSSVAMPVLPAGTVTYDIDKGVLQALRDMSLSIDGFDYGALPIDGPGLLMADLGVWSQRGSVLPNIAFEFGLGLKNIQTYDIDNDPMRLTTHEHVVGRSISDSTGAASRSDITPSNNAIAAATYAAYGQLFDSVDSFTDLADATLLGAMGTQLVTWRSAPRQVITFTPAQTAAYMPLRDFDVGDYIPVRINDGRYTGSRQIDALARVYGWKLKRGADGRVRTDSITVQPTDQGGD